jgi:polysaccharide pyruvyl transferase WcaK-like protein
MKILLAGGYDTQNLGDHGMLAVFGRDLRKLDPDIEIVLLSRHPDPMFDETYGVRSILNLSEHMNINE